MVSLSHNLHDMPGRVPRMDVLFWGRHDFQISFSNRDTWRNVWNRHWRSFSDMAEIPLKRRKSSIWRSFMVDTGILSSDQSLYQSVAFLPNLDVYWLMRGFHRTFATGVACWHGTPLTPPDTCSRPILGLAYVLLVEPDQSFSLTCRYFSGLST